SVASGMDQREPACELTTWPSRILSPESFTTSTAVGSGRTWSSRFTTSTIRARFDCFGEAFRKNSPNRDTRNLPPRLLLDRRRLHPQIRIDAVRVRLVQLDPNHQPQLPRKRHPMPASTADELQTLLTRHRKLNAHCVPHM